MPAGPIPAAVIATNRSNQNERNHKESTHRCSIKPTTDEQPSHGSGPTAARQDDSQNAENNPKKSQKLGQKTKQTKKGSQQAGQGKKI